MRLAGILRGEMGRRQLLEEERSRLLARSGERLGVPAEAVTLGLLGTLTDSATGEHARVRSAELRGLLHELQREHTCNRSLMQIELGFLDHLMGMLSLDGVNGYDTHGSSRSITRPRPHGALHVLDLPRLAMSIPTLQGLQTALSGLIAEQTALDTTGNNIANANTEGYSRQTALLEPNPPIPIPAISAQTGEGAQLGAGVTVATITRIRNGYLDSQYRTQNSALGAATAEAEVLERAQAAFNEPSSAGIATQLSKFWSAWNSLAESPSSEAAKEVVVAAGKQLATTVNELSAQLSTFATQAGEEYNSLAGPSGEVEDDANQLAQLNRQIKLAEEAGQPPNDMLDRRDLLLDKLSGLANITVTEQPDHTDTVTFGEAAKPLVEGTTVNWPQELTESSGGRARRADQADRPQRCTDRVAGGSSTKLPARSSSTVNGVLPKAFFSGATAATLSVALGAAEVAGVRHRKAPAPTNSRSRSRRCAAAPPNSSYAGLVEKVGSVVRTAQDEKTNLQTTVTSISDQRQAVSGVSLDEEMTNLITYPARLSGLGTHADGDGAKCSKP